MDRYYFLPKWTAHTNVLLTEPRRMVLDGTASNADTLVHSFIQYNYNRVRGGGDCFYFFFKYQCDDIMMILTYRYDNVLWRNTASINKIHEKQALLRSAKNLLFFWLTPWRIRFFLLLIPRTLLAPLRSAMSPPGFWSWRCCLRQLK